MPRATSNDDTPQPPEGRAETVDDGKDLRGISWFEWATIGVLSLGLLITLLIGHTLIAYNSDAAGVPNLVQSWMAGVPFAGYTGSDPFFIKFPLMWLQNLLISNSRGTLFALALACNVVMILGLVLMIRRVGGLNRASSKLRIALCYLPLTTFVSLSIAKMDRGDGTPGTAGYGISNDRADSFLNIDNRNAEIGVALLILCGVDWALHSRQLSTRRRLLALAGLGACAGLLCYSDPLFLVPLIGGMLASAGLFWVRRESSWRLPATVAVVAVVALLGFVAWTKVMTAIGLTTIDSIVQGFIGAEYLSRGLSNGLGSLLYVFRAGFLGHEMMWTSTKVLVLNAILPALFLVTVVVTLVGLLRGPRVRLSWLTGVLVLGAILNFAALSLSYLGMDPNYYRYVFVAALFMLPLMGKVLADAMERITTRRLAAVTAVALVGLIALNGAVNVRTYAVRDHSKVQKDDYDIIAAAKRNNLSKGYANYWNASIVSYLSNREVISLELKCDKNNRLVKSPWIVNGGDFDLPADRVFWVHKTSGDELSCADQLPKPQQVEKVNDRYELWIYDQDFAKPLPMPVVHANDKDNVDKKPD